MLREISLFHARCRSFDADLEDALGRLAETKPRQSRLLAEIEYHESERTGTSPDASRRDPQPPEAETGILVSPQTGDDGTARRGERNAAIAHAMFLQNQLATAPAPSAAAAVAVGTDLSHGSETPRHADDEADNTGPVAERDWEREAMQAVDRGEWKQAVDKRGRTYFMNKRERVTVWNLAKELQRRSALQTES